MPSKPARRRHSAEFKANVLAACDEPGASVAAAVAHDLNANLVHKGRLWTIVGGMGTFVADMAKLGVLGAAALAGDDSEAPDPRPARGACRRKLVREAALAEYRASVRQGAGSR